MKIDTFAHILTPKFYKKMLEIEPTIPDRFPFIKIKTLVDLDERLTKWPEQGMRQVVSFANINPENFAAGQTAVEIATKANQELAEVVAAHPDKFVAGVGMLAMNNIAGSQRILENIKQDRHLVGAQIFTRHLSKSIADPEFSPILAKAAELGIPLWLHPVFDKHKPDNNLVFSWEYELSQAMLQLVQSDIFVQYPNLKILVHHAGAMVPFFSGRIEHILDSEHAQMFKKFYVDTAILGNSPALQLAIDYYGIDHVLFGTDAPFAVMPSGANDLVSQAIDYLKLSPEESTMIYYQNYRKLVN